MPHNPAAPKRRRDPRFDYRARSHASAHAEAPTAPQKIPDHPLICRSPATLIDTQPGLDELIEHLRGQERFAYDSEFIGEASYLPKLCLIQVATPLRVVLIDALAGLHLNAFWDLLTDDRIEKIVHAGQQDLEPVFRNCQRPCVNIFDTQMAAGFIGMAFPVGLSKLVKESVGVQLGKGFTFTHWDQRPLSAVQIRYAADDVRYLPAVRKHIGQELERLGHLAWAKEECDALCDPALYSLDPEKDFRRIRGCNSLGPQGLAILRELAEWREAAARRQDVPPRSLVKDEILIELARHPVADVAGLSRVRGLPRPVENTEGANIVQATARGLAVPPDKRPCTQIVEESPAERFTIDAIWATVQVWCAGQKVDPSLVSSRQEIGRLWRDMQRAGSLPAEHRLLTGWRAELIGNRLREFFAGRGWVKLSWRDSGLHSEPGGE